MKQWHFILHTSSIKLAYEPSSERALLKVHTKRLVKVVVTDYTIRNLKSHALLRNVSHKFHRNLFCEFFKRNIQSSYKNVSWSSAAMFRSSPDTAALISSTLDPFFSNWSRLR